MIERLARAELTAAGIEDPPLVQGYLRARQLNAEHGKTYYLATLLLAPAKRPYVHALYGFARYADDIVDDLDPAILAADRATLFRSWSQAFLADLDSGRSTDPIATAVLDTIARWQLPAGLFADFLHSMAMDLTVTEYADYPALAKYMWGSAAVIGLQMLPILGFDQDRSEPVRQSAIDLGLAFQLTNFLRDVGEDLDRGRIYLPQDSLAAAGVDRQRLEFGRRTATVDEPIRTLLRAEIARTRALYRSAELGIPFLDRSSRDCIRTAATLYEAILDQLEQRDYNVFDGRASVSVGQRARVAGPGLFRAWRSRRPDRSQARSI